MNCNVTSHMIIPDIIWYPNFLPDLRRPPDPPSINYAKVPAMKLLKSTAVATDPAPNDAKCRVAFDPTSESKGPMKVTGSFQSPAWGTWRGPNNPCYPNLICPGRLVWIEIAVCRHSFSGSCFYYANDLVLFNRTTDFRS